MTFEEREKAAKLFAAKSPQKKQAEAKHKKVKVSEAFSKGERNLYREVQQIRRREEAERSRREAEQRMATMPREYVGMPEAPLITHLRKKANSCYTNRPTDSELLDVEDFLRKADAPGKGFLTAEAFKSFMQSLYKDACDMGKVPIPLPEKELELLISEIKPPSEEEKDELPLRGIMGKMGEIEWRLLTAGELKERTEKLYAEVGWVKT